MQIADFYQDAKARYGLRLIAGGAGVTREFNWVHLVEDIGNAGFLRGGELVITTGLMCERREGGCRRSSSSSCATARAAST